VATPHEGPDPSLPDDISDKIGKQLQLRLVELIALSLTGKQLLWNACEREFLSAHRHLDLVVDEWRELEDAVAGERRHTSRRQRARGRRTRGKSCFDSAALRNRRIPPSPSIS
jgi:hypothetical protein